MSAYLTFIICTISYFLNQEKLSNEIDKRVINFVVDRRCIRKIAISLSEFFGIPNAKTWDTAFQSAVLDFSDQQIMTGLAILVSGYVQLRCRGLAVYHWQIVVDLAFFSSTTHLTTLTCLRTYFKVRRILRLIRLLSMAVVAVMLACALYSTGYLNGIPTSPDLAKLEMSFPAWCLYHRDAMHEYQKDNGIINFNSAYIVIVLTYLSFSYLTRSIHLFSDSLEGTDGSFSVISRRWPFNKLVKTITRAKQFFSMLVQRTRDKALEHPRRFQMCWILFYRFILSWQCMQRGMIDLYRSVIWEVCLLPSRI